MSIESLFRIEIRDGAVKVTPSEELVSMPRDQQIATLEEKLRMFQAELQNIDNSPDRDQCEIELMIVILKNLIKQFRDSYWEHIS